MDVARVIRIARQEAGLSQVQLAARAGTSQPAVSKYESGVTSPSVATLTRLLACCGKQMHLSLVDRPPASGEGPVGQLIRSRRKQLRTALARHGARNPRLFGSVARGTDGPNSDVDLLVDLPRASYVLLAQVEHAAEAALGVGVDVSTPELLRDEIRTAVLEQAVPL